MIAVFHVAHAHAGSARLVPQQSDLQEWRGYYRTGIAFSQDGRTVAVTGAGVDLWSSNGYFLRHLGMRYYPLEWPPTRKRERLAKNDVSGALFLKNGGELAAFSKTDNTVRFYNTLTCGSTRNIALRGEGAIWSIAVSPDEKRLAIGTTTGTIETWDLETNTFIRQMEAPAPYVTQVGFLGNSREIVSSAVELYKTTCSSGRCTTMMQQGKVSAAISVWDSRGGLRNAVRRDIEASSPAFSVLLGRDEIGIIKNGNVELLDKKLATITEAAIPAQDVGKHDYSRILFSPDGKSLLLARKNGHKAFSLPR